MSIIAPSSASTKEYTIVPTNRMTREQVRDALGENRSILRVIEQQRRIQAVFLIAQSQKKAEKVKTQKQKDMLNIIEKRTLEIASLNKQAEAKIALIKELLNQQLIASQQKWRQKSRLAYIKKQQLQKREEQLEERQRENEIINLIYPRNHSLQSSRANNQHYNSLNYSRRLRSQIKKPANSQILKKYYE